MIPVVQTYTLRANNLQKNCTKFKLLQLNSKGSLTVTYTIFCANCGHVI